MVSWVHALDWEYIYLNITFVIPLQGYDTQGNYAQRSTK